MDLKLKNKIVLVTGGASGIGEAIVNTFAEEQAIPVILDINFEKAKQIETELKSKNRESLALEVDLLDDEACQKAVRTALEKYQRIDSLINNAGRNDKVALGSPVDDFRKSLELNLVQYYSMANACLPSLIQSKGTIVNISSKVALTGQGGTSGYAAAKGGVLGLTREWAVQLLKYGIRVNALLPAEVWTPLYESIISASPNPQESLQKIKASIPLGNRLTKPQEIADMVVFLASHRASHITGQFLFVDGGYTHLDRAVCSGQ